MSHEQSYTIPPTVATQTDLRRLLSEVERLDGDATTANIRERVGHPMGEEIIMSEQLQDFTAANQLNLADGHIRSQVIADLRQLKDGAPVVHVTFAATAGRDELAELVAWVRQSVHPQAVLTVGLQPDLIGGAHIRTTNKVFDLSVRAQLADGRKIIATELEALGGVVGGAV